MNVFEIFGTIGLKDAGFNKGISDATAKGESFGQQFSNVAAKVGKAAAVGLGAAATAFAGLSVKALKLGGDLEQSIGGIETLFKSTANTVIKNAEKAYLTAGVSANDYMQQVTSFSASLLQSLGGDTVEAARVADMAIIDMSDNANKMGTAIESIQYAYQGFGKQNYTMLDNLKLGFGGTKSEMQRLLVEAEKISGIKYDITNLNDVYQAIHVIQGELGITGTTAKEGMETLNGALATSKAALSNFLSGAGGVEPFIDSVGNLADIVADRVGKLVPRLLEGLGLAFKKLVAKIGDVVPVLKPVTSTILFLAKHAKLLAAVILSLVAAFVALKVVAAIQKTFTLAIGVMKLYAAGANLAMISTLKLGLGTKILGTAMAILSGDLKLAAVATKLFGAAVKIASGPVGWIIAGIAALATATIFLVKHLNKQSEESKKLVEENKKLAESTNALNDSLRDSQNAYEDSTRSIYAETAATNELAEQVYDLAAVENKTGAQKRKLASLVEILNGSMEDLNLQYNAEQDTLSKTAPELKKIIALRSKEAKAALAQERAVELVREQMLIEEQLNKIRSQRADLTTAYESGAMKAKAYNKAIKELNEQQAALNVQSADVAAAFEYTAEIIAESTNVVTNSMEQQAAVLEAKAEAQTKALESLSKEYTKYADAASGMFSKLSDKSDLTFKQINANIQENTRVVGDWGKNIATLAKKNIDEGLLTYLKGLGTEGAGYVATLAKASNEQIKQLNESWRKSKEIAEETVVSVWGVDPGIAQAAADMATASATAFEQELAAADFFGKGKAIAQSVADGIAETTRLAVDAARQMALAVGYASTPGTSYVYPGLTTTPTATKAKSTSIVQNKHSGTIRIEGATSEEEYMKAMDIIYGDLRNDLRMAKN